MKINKFSNDLPKEIVSQIKDSIAIDTEATGLKIPERDKLSLIQICDAKGEVYVIQPDRKTYKAPNLVSILENDKILSQKKNIEALSLYWTFLLVVWIIFFLIISEI